MHIAKALTRQYDEGPSYEALSYAWGSASQPSYANVSTAQQSGIISITRNLDVALRHLRYKKKPRYMWVDALCINQANSKEKDIQVMNMGAIFATANSVLAWLGPKENNSDEAIAWFQATGRKLYVDWETMAMRSHKPEATKEPVAQEEQERLEMAELVDEPGRLPWTLEETRSVCSILLRPYFERAWIVQEIRLAKRVLFQCGMKLLSEYDLWKTIMMMNRKSFNVPSVSYRAWFDAFQRIWSLTYVRARKERVSIYTLRCDLGRFVCNDVRDKIYAVLALMDAQSQDLHIRPAYTQAPERVYRDIARHVYTTWTSLLLLEECELSSRALDIPSWVPDWSTPLKESWSIRKWSACAFIAVQPTFDEAGLRCSVQSVFTGQVTEVGEQLWNADKYTAEDMMEFIRALLPALGDLISIYVTGQSLMEVYCHILVGGRLSTPELFLSLAHPDFVRSFNLLRLAWSGNANVEDFAEDLRRRDSYLHIMVGVTQNRRLFKTVDGHVGLASDQTQVGDVLFVLLGCPLPVILRPTVNRTYQVVGTCYAHGLMNGEAIYHNTHEAKKQSSPGCNPYARSFNPDINDPKFDIVEILEKAGIQVQGRREDSPYGIFVSPEALRDAGIPVQDVDLV